MTFTLYHCRDARSLRTLWALEELEVPYTLEGMPFPPRYEHKSYLEVNPLGTVPLLTDGKHVHMTESAATCEYLAQRFGPTPLAVTPEEDAYPAYLTWLHRSDATLTFPLAIVLRYVALEPKERQLPQAAEDYTIWFLARAASIATALEKSDYLCADRFTMADLVVIYAIYFAMMLGMKDKFPASTLAWYERCTDRPAFKRAQEAQEHIPPIL
ncbi:MAG: glutathione S-transferase family protein [Pseudomonadota bacterium]